MTVLFKESNQAMRTSPAPEDMSSWATLRPLWSRAEGWREREYEQGWSSMSITQLDNLAWTEGQLSQSIHLRACGLSTDISRCGGSRLYFVCQILYE